MKPIKRKFTPVRMLDVLTEIKILCKRNEFLPKTYCKKQPSIWHFTRVLIQKGVLKKEKDQYKWIGGEPNVEMAKGVIDSVNEYNQIKKVERESKVQNNENVVVEIPMTNQELMTSYYSESKEFQLKNYQLQEQILAIKKELEDYEFEISDLLKENENLKHQIHQFLKIKSKPFDEIFEADIEQKKELVLEKPIPKKVKLFGITILKIE